MNGYQRTLAALLVGLVASGCQGPRSRQGLSANEPPLSLPEEGGVPVVQAPPVRPVTFADRHPLFSKPREYYDNAGSNNKVVKAAAATVIGVPAGVVGELRQIVVGQPQAVLAP